MKEISRRTGRWTVLLLAAAALASCTAHGQGKKLDRKVYVNHVPYGEAFYRKLMTGRIDLFEGLGRFRNVVGGQIFASDGTVIECTGRQRLDRKVHWIGQTSTRWSLVHRRAGVRAEWDYGGDHKRYASKFYDPATGAFSTEIFWEGSWIVASPGHIQDSWPRALADACPDLKLPAHVRINEKQTSLKMDELRRQDPEAPIRNFPGSHLTAPGRTGLGASGGRPTTTKEEVWAFMRAQHGNIMLSPRGHPRVLVLDGVGGPHEIWQLGKDGEIAGVSEFQEVADDAGEWLETRREGKRLGRYPMGYPFPYLPTGHRHPAFQLTGALVAVPKPTALAFMGEAYADRRFMFYGTGRLAVVDLAGALIVEGSWRWTRGRLEVAVDGDAAGARSVGWREFASQLGRTPAAWKPPARNAG